MPDWQNRLKIDMDFATKTLLDRGSVAPMFVLHQRDGATLVVITEFSNDAEKDAVADYIHNMCIANDVIGFSMISEAWMIALSSAEIDAELEKRRPSQSPDRIEVINVALVYRDEDRRRRCVISAMAEILRDDSEKILGVRAIDFGNDDYTEGKGRIPSILPLEPPTREDQEVAQKMIKIWN